jgi:Ran GTPase-activating protein (RanGAP) involved in mRNA processing and transport
MFFSARLKRNPLKMPGMIPINHLLTRNKTLQVLDLLNCGLLDPGVSVLFKDLHLNTTLKHIYLSANGITPVGLESIRDYFNKGTSQLESLFLGCNRVGDEGAAIVADILRIDSKLARLNLASCRIGAEGMKSLSEALVEKGLYCFWEYIIVCAQNS